MKAIIASIVLGLAITANAADTKAPAAPATAPAAQTAPATTSPSAQTTAPAAPTASTTKAEGKKVAKTNFKKECKEKLGKEASKADVKKCVADLKKEAKSTK